jgi:ABC-type polar amino acid transport system ATPase subunit
MMLQASNVHKSIDGHRILTAASIIANPGEITAIIGPNGAGKSTFLRCLSLVEAPDVGEIMVGDIQYKFPRSSTKDGQRQPWPELTAVFQGLHLWPHITIRENILLPVKKRRTAGGHAGFKELVDAFDLGHVLDRFPNQSSGGERQRAAIVRSLILKPRYLLLDEPTAASDVEHVRTLLQFLLRARDSGMTIVVVTHLLRFARQLADKVIFMEDGKIVTAGPAAIIDHSDNDRLAQFVAVF